MSSIVALFDCVVAAPIMAAHQRHANALSGNRSFLKFRTRKASLQQANVARGAFFMAQCRLLSLFCILLHSYGIQPILASYHVQVYYHRIALRRGSRLCPSADLLFLVGAQGDRLLEGSWRSGSVGPLRYVVRRLFDIRRIPNVVKSMLEGLRLPTVFALFASATNVCISVACSYYADRIGRVYLKLQSRIENSHHFISISH